MYFIGFHQYKARALKCLAQGHSHEKPSGPKHGSDPVPQVTSPTLYYLARQEPADD